MAAHDKKESTRNTRQHDDAAMSEGTDDSIVARPDLMVHVHAHNWALWSELEASIVHAVRRPYDLYVTLPIDAVSDVWEREAQRAQILRDHPCATVLLMENRGMDPGGFLIALHHARLRRPSTTPLPAPTTSTATATSTTPLPPPPQSTAPAYRYVLKLHTKTDDAWRRRLVQPMLRDAETFERCMALIADNDGGCNDVGMVGAADLCVDVAPDDGHFATAAFLAKMADITFAAEAHLFIGGTMFLARVAPIARWTDAFDAVELVSKHMLPGRGAWGSAAHAMERLFCMLMPVSGLRVQGVP